MPMRPPKVSEIAHKTVLVRVDFNVPLKERSNKNGQLQWVVADDQRLRNALETIHFLQENEAKIILMSHLGRPDGKVNPAESLAPVAAYLRKHLDLPCQFVEDCIGESVVSAVSQLQAGEILLLENLRFHAEEEKNEPSFAHQLSLLAEVYINEAFSASHRAHASITGVTQYLPSFAGFALAYEVKMLGKVLENVQHPFMVVMGGAKIDDKVNTLKNLAKSADLVLLGGGLANTFLKAGGIETHQTQIGQKPKETVAIARHILTAHKTERYLLPIAAPLTRMSHSAELPLPKIIFPVDVKAAADKNISKKQEVRTVELVKNVQDTDQNLPIEYFDIGQQTIHLYSYLLSQAKTIFWNGPLGYFENPLFAQGSREIARTLARLDKRQVTTICGGGETGELINSMGLRDRFTHVSTAGGAALEFLGGSELPGIQALATK